jgi:hypothetical protein
VAANPTAKITQPVASRLREVMLESKPLLKKVYADWYRLVALHVPERTEPALEVGSINSYLKETVPNLITSSSEPTPHSDIAFSPGSFPFGNRSLRSILTINRFYEVSQPDLFLNEGARCLVPGGTMVFLEPWTTPLARIISGGNDRNLTPASHNQPNSVVPEQPSSWLPGQRSNPYQFFTSDWKLANPAATQFEVSLLQPISALRYAVAGGFDRQCWAPGWTNIAWKGFEALLNPCASQLGLFALIVLKRLSDPKAAT